MTSALPVAGIDLGSVTVGLVLLGPDGKVLRPEEVIPFDDDFSEF